MGAKRQELGAHRWGVSQKNENKFGYSFVFHYLCIIKFYKLWHSINYLTTLRACLAMAR